MKRMLGAALAAALSTAGWAGAGHAADIDDKEFAVVGTWGNLINWKEHESRLWQSVLPDASARCFWLPAAHAAVAVPLVVAQLVTVALLLRDNHRTRPGAVEVHVDVR